MFWLFDCKSHGILAPQRGIEPAPSTLEGEVLTSGPPGKSLVLFIYLFLVLATPLEIWGLGTLTRDQTCAPCSESAES